eukprot:2442917-Karenia_brevis.AAC.1
MATQQARKVCSMGCSTVASDGGHLETAGSRQEVLEEVSIVFCASGVQFAARGQPQSIWCTECDTSTDHE